MKALPLYIPLAPSQPFPDCMISCMFILLVSNGCRRLGQDASDTTPGGVLTCLSSVTRQQQGWSVTMLLMLACMISQGFKTYRCFSTVMGNLTHSSQTLSVCR